jgi:hypothetical protein
VSLKIFRHINTKYPWVVGVVSVPSWWRPLVAEYTRKISMYLPRGKLLALIAVVVAASMVSATGAFSTVKAERNVDVKVTGDKGAFLSLKPATSPNANEYVKMKSGKLSINLDGSVKKNAGKGVNPDAVTKFDKLFVISNYGSQDIKVTFNETPNSKAVTFYTKSKKNIEGGFTIAEGKSKTIGIKVNTRGDKVQLGKKGGTKKLVDSIKIKAKGVGGGDGEKSDKGKD